ncbi:MAG: hypothetical protein BZY80_01790 [SAR202 cluster bacterium Io17-Chloro-G2]|nr:MAG: hypothetical protein BZY80_01790 [SAR202 cluster bacterium Io17-Chloro-G2]
MGLKYGAPDPLQQVHVALDLETTGLDSNRDAIIEIGAVKFQGGEDIDTFQTFIKPARPIPDFVQRLTGISPDQVSRAPLFSSVSRDLEDFIGASPVIGHNVSFDLRFLDSHDLPLANTTYDTWDLASVLLPRTTQYSLGFLASHFGVVHDKAHRALDDAKATQHVFLALLQEAAALDPGLLAHLANLAQRSDWSIAPLLMGLEQARNGPGPNAAASVFGLTGLDLESIGSRLGRVEKRRAEPTLASMDEDKISGLLSSNGPFSKAFEGFEYRPEQEQMLAAVTNAIYQGQHLVVEGGTGVGKSMAYLLPAALFAVSQGQRVVISTNTINLQEQLMSKDIPAMISVLEDSGLVSTGVIKAAQLKGRANYLCLRRWNFLASAESPSVDDARLLGKTSVWLQNTVNGDRGEINLSGRDAFTWTRVSAGEGGWCPGLRDGSPCFLRTARERADQAHLIVVNHALLMSDLARGGSLIPDYQHLIIDEAHNLEDAATRQLGFKAGPDGLDDALETHGRLITQLRLAMAAEGLASPVRQEAEKVVGDVEGAAPRLREVWARLWSSAERFFTGSRKGRGEGPDAGQSTGQSLLLTQAGSGSGGSRDGQQWAELSLDWENAGAVLQQTVQGLERIGRFLQTDPLPGPTDGPTLAMEAGNIQDKLEQLRVQLDSILGGHDPKAIHWMDRGMNRGQSRDQGGADLSFNSAPLEVGATLAEQLFDSMDSVVLTSATLSTQSNFEYIRHRTGLPEESGELLVGSPFDYQKAALLLIPDDMPAPNQDGYLDAITRVLGSLGKTLDGHTMALFTSYSALRAVAQKLRSQLVVDGVEVLAQSVDGSPQQLLSRFIANPASVLLGTSSFWEGVDLPPGVLKALVLTRLPFGVPTDPIIKTRSEQYQDPFKEFSIPQAVLRFRQGIGRLIRNKGDKGSIIVLDRRITGRSYGGAFMQSIPPCTLKPSSLFTVADLSADWIGKGAPANPGVKR